MAATDYPDCRYEIEARDSALGGGWRLRLLEDGEEVGGGAFPLAEYLAAEHVGSVRVALDRWQIGRVHALQIRLARRRLAGAAR